MLGKYFSLRLAVDRPHICLTKEDNLPPAGL
jgi:hypothetical protein